MNKIKGALDLKKEILRENLCTACGACVGLCGYFGTFQGRVVMLDSCELTEGRCYAFCPRTKTDNRRIRTQFFDQNDLHPDIGPCRGLYMTRAIDEKIRAGSQHGGTVTALLKLAMEEGFIDAAILTRSAGGLNPHGVLVSRTEDVEKCAGSSFQIAPSLAILNQALKENQHKRIGVVGTPCKTLAVYKMKSYYQINNDENMNKIPLVIGLFCGWGLEWLGLEKVMKRWALDEDVLHIDFPPSKYQIMEIQTRRKRIEVPLNEIYEVIKESCNYCPDLTAEFSDLSVGGSRSSKGWDFDRGWNQVIVRTINGEELLKTAKEKKVLEFHEIESQNIDKLKRAHIGKRNKAVQNILKRTGTRSDLSYLDLEDAVLESCLEDAIRGMNEIAKKVE
ncbi:MAG: Coenzyme F420 hydrogenase/dehydrogenase, beta subunit C-terminal domain [Thermodesulfobacteriota bacterium]